MCNSQKTVTKAEATYLRKIKKPLIEKRRRDRMNRSLEHLKDILLQTDKENQYQFSKLDKAEILEMTLTLIQKLHNQQKAVTMPADAARAYQSGFKDCARHTMTYLNSTNSLGSTELSRLNNHLHNAYNERVIAQTVSSSTTKSVVKPKATYPHHGRQTYTLSHPVSQHPVNDFTVQSLREDDASSAPPTFPIVPSGGGNAVNIFREEAPWRPW